MLGHAHLMARAAVAVIGARNSSAVGGRLAREFAAGFSRHNLTVVSGLARGIDSAAHAGALAGGTLAVLAGGVDVVYPPQNQDLYEQIRDGGVIISELALGTQPQAHHFPRRNRIISGLSLAVVVIEASLRSGSLITARLAGEQGREVCAVPGSPLDPRYRGTNKLIRQGATLVESADDVVEIIRPQLGRALFEPVRTGPDTGPALDPKDIDLIEETTRTAVLDRLSPTPVEVDEIIRQCQLTPAKVWTVVLELELAGRLLRHHGGKVSLNISNL
jgi:DNA processing protein